MNAGRTLVYAIIGAVISIVLSFLPLSTVVGGTVSGFLEGPDPRDGAITGAIAGAIVFLPFLAIGFFLLGVVGFGLGLGAAPVEGIFVVLLVFAFVGTAALVYTVGLSALGGFLGAHLAREYPDERRRTRETIGMRPEPARRPPVAERPREDASPGSETEPLDGGSEK